MKKKEALYLLLMLLLAASSLHAQTPLAGSGTRFTFSLPEGAERITKPPDTSRIFLRILSPYSGKVSVKAVGYSNEFTFSPNAVTTIELPRSLVIYGPTGQYSKGISVVATQPVSAVLHRFMPFAGEATQLYPDNIQGKEFVVSSWGVFDDPNEDNIAQVVVSAIYPETIVTIYPRLGMIDGAPITRVMGPSESYILKADVRTAANVEGYCGTRISATYPVSVITNVSCGYVPLGREACNEMLDELLPKSYFGTVFYATPLSDSAQTARLIFTSDSMHFTVLSGRGLFQETFNGRIEMQLSRPDVFSVSRPAQCQLITDGYDVVQVGDPSMVQILPPEFYSDSLYWNTPYLVSTGQVFQHFVSIVFPQDAKQDVKLDGIPVATLGTVQNIPQSTMAAMQIEINPGNHSVTSTKPVFAVASGFLPADVYTFLPVGRSKQVLDVSGQQKESAIRITTIPNPANDKLYVTKTGNGSVLRYRLYDELGQVALERTLGITETTVVDISTLASGTYTLSALTPLGEITVRVVIVR